MNVNTEKNKGWIGVDLDGTLARYDKWPADGSIGEPIPKMLERVKAWLAEGKDVRIVTARACGFGSRNRLCTENLDAEQVELVQNWCIKHIGFSVPVQFWKDGYMHELWDDRAIQVEQNTGLRVDGKD